MIHTSTYRLRAFLILLVIISQLFSCNRSADINDTSEADQIVGKFKGSLSTLGSTTFIPNYEFSISKNGATTYTFHSITSSPIPDFKIDYAVTITAQNLYYTIAPQVISGQTIRGGIVGTYDVLYTSGNKQIQYLYVRLESSNVSTEYSLNGYKLP